MNIITRLRAKLWGWQLGRWLEDFMLSKDPGIVKWKTVGPITLGISRDWRDTGNATTWCVIVSRINVDYYWRPAQLESLVLAVVEQYAYRDGYNAVVVYGDRLAEHGRGYRLVRDDMWVKP